MVCFNELNIFQSGLLSEIETLIIHLKFNWISKEKEIISSIKLYFIVHVKMLNQEVVYIIWFKIDIFYFLILAFAFKASKV